MIGKKIKALRIKEGLTQEELGSLIGEQQHTISNYENEKRKINSEFLELIMDKLGYKILFVKKERENMGYGFLNITEEEWEDLFCKYRGSAPNKSNSDYDDRMVNFFECFDEDCEDGFLDGFCKDVLNQINSSEFKNTILKADYDIDYDNQICFFDLILNEDILISEIEELFKYINSKF